MNNEQNGTALAVATKASPLIALGERFAIEPAKLVEVLRGTVIKPTKDGRVATNEEVAAFCMVANQYGLNPFTREIHAFADPQKGVVPIVGIDGWCHIVNAQPGFDGVEFTEVSDEKGKPLSVTCVMHVKGREHPTQITEYYAECYRPTAPWNTMPRRMLRHKAFMQCGRYAFSLSGIYDEDEARDIAKLAPIHSVEGDPGEAVQVGEATAKLAKKLAKKADKPVSAEPNADECPADLSSVAQEASEGHTLDVERENAVLALEGRQEAFPKGFVKACVKIGIDPAEWKTAPKEAILRLLKHLEAEDGR
jgi:phage recombination protein Bet